MNNILICGCSFTQSRINDRPEWINSDRSWIPYSDLLYHEFPNKIKNIGQDSASNGWIYNTTLAELLKNNFSYDFVIIQWSAVMRAHFPDSNLEGITKNWPVGNPSVGPHLFEYIARDGLTNGNVTNLLNEVSSHFYLNTLIYIYSLQKILESNNIPYLMFWGWEQITDKIYQEYKYIFNKIYNKNFWKFGKNGGLSEYCISKLGENKSILKDDFHPTTEAHNLFYEDIIKPILNNL